MPTFSALRVVTAPATEPVSLQAAKKHLRVTQDDQDDLIATYLTAARAWAEDYLGRALITQQLRWYIAREHPTGAYPFVSLPFPVTIYPLWYPWPDVMHRPLEMPRAPVQTIDRVSYGKWDGTETALDASAYGTDVNLGRLHLAGGAVPQSHDYLAITFTAGYGLDGSVVPSPITLGILLLLAWLYENRGDAAGELPVAAKRLFDMNRRVTFGG